MLTRAPSLRYWLLVAMIASAVLGLGAAVLLFNHVETAHERTADAAKARQEARTIAAEIQAGAGPARLRALQELLANDQITVIRGGRVVFQGPPRTGREFELQVQAAFPGGLVRLTDYASPASTVTLELTLITAGVLALVIAGDQRCHPRDAGGPRARPTRDRRRRAGVPRRLHRPRGHFGAGGAREARERVR